MESVPAAGCNNKVDHALEADWAYISHTYVRVFSGETGRNTRGEEEQNQNDQRVEIAHNGEGRR